MCRRNLQVGNEIRNAGDRSSLWVMLQEVLCQSTGESGSEKH